MSVCYILYLYLQTVIYSVIELMLFFILQTCIFALQSKLYFF